MARSVSKFAIAFVLGALPSVGASAMTIGFSLTGDTATVHLDNGLDADASLDSNTDSVDLTPGVASDVFLNAGNVDVFQGSDSTGSATFDQTLSITSPSARPSSRSLSQDIFVTTTAGSPPFTSDSADVTLSGASPLVFELNQFELTVTPTGGSRTDQTDTSIPFSNYSTFLLTPTPEPACGAVLLLAPALLLKRRRKHRQGAGA